MAATSTDNIITFFTSQTQNISSVPVTCGFNTGVLKVWGTWNGANIVIQTGVPGDPNTYIPITDANGNALTFTKDTQITLSNIVLGDNLVAVLSSVGLATSLNATLQRV